MHGSVIIVPANVDQIQLILSCLPHENATICVFLNDTILNTNHFIC